MRGPETIGSILKAPEHLKKGQNFKIIISRFPYKYKPNRSGESENSSPETLGSILMAPGPKNL